MKVSFTGDFAPILNVEDRLRRGHIEDIFGNLIELFNDHDEVVVNLECPLTVHDVRSKKTGPNIRANPGIGGALRKAGISIASLANNHIMDYGPTGLKDTIECLSSNGVACFGAGENLMVANSPFVIRNNDESIALVSYAEHEYSIAGIDYPGANPINPLRNAVELKRLLSEHNYVIVLVHGGHEYQALPSPYYVDLMRFYASLGVHAVIGHHTHCVSLMENYQGVPICYGLGNFIFPWNEIKSKAWYEGVVLSLDIMNGNIAVRVIPVRQDTKGQVSLSNAEIMDFGESKYLVEEGYFDSEEYILQAEKFLRGKGKAAFLSMAVPSRLIRGLIKHGFVSEQYIIKNRFLGYFHSFHCEGSLEAIRAYLNSHLHNAFVGRNKV